MRRVVAAVVSVLVASPGHSQTAVEPYGYVVGLPTDTEWRVAAGGRIETITVGSVLRAGGAISVAAVKSNDQPAIAVMEYSTGRVVALKAGTVVPSGRPPGDSAWARLREAIHRRLSNENFRDGVIRTRVLLKDALHIVPGAMPWSSLVADLPPGDYRVRFRRLDAEGVPVGDWTPQSTIAVSATGITPSTHNGELAGGLWQVSIRHQQSPSIGGDAWLVLTPDREAVRQYAALVRTLAEAEASSDPQIVQSAVRVRRAALLALAPGA
jgi:hypothetical protein